MYKPKVTQIENPSVISEREITGPEAEQILRKYGYTQEYSTRQYNTVNLKSNNLTFEQMVTQKELEVKRNKELQRQKLNSPKPITFDGNNGYDSKIKYGSDDEFGFGFKIEITTDMKLPK